MNFFRRLTQGASLVFFLWLLWGMRGPAPVELPDCLPPDLFLRLDPLAALAVPLAAREAPLTLLPGIGILFTALLCGRFFCGWFCPFGVTLDLIRRIGGLSGRPRSPLRDAFRPPDSWRLVKYFLLIAILAAAAFGVNEAFLAAPIPLITRFYATCIFPLIELTGKHGLDFLRDIDGLTGIFDLGSLAYAQISPRRFEAVFFMLCFFGTLFALERLVPRFWCRHLCPAGALLGFFSSHPLWRRHVAGDCTDCGRCRRQCPTGAAGASGAPAAASGEASPLAAVFTNYRECLACRRCTAVCPKITFRIGRQESAALPPARSGAAVRRDLPAALPNRRQFIQAGIVGASCAAGSFLGLDSLQSGATGAIIPPALIRPPGAVPEEDFLRLCLRCGACMQACPSNGLQPVWFLAGLAGMFSPALVPRRGACEASCNACGRVCPSRALRALSLEEKQRAKIGAAVVLRQKCLAWEQNKRCVVCQEVCPYGAVSLRPAAQGNDGVPAPFVRADRCFGCGACERHCPVESSAIVVESLGALRLAGGSYIDAAREARLTLELTPKDALDLLPGGEALPEGALPPGFTE